MHILVCSLEGRRYGFDLGRVERGMLAVEVTSLPNMPGHVLGAVNIHGDIVPVINLRKLLGLPLREVDANDHFVLCKAHNRSVALWVDHAKTVRKCSEGELLPAEGVIPGIHAAEHVLKEDGEITLLFDLDRLIPSGA